MTDRDDDRQGGLHRPEWTRLKRAPFIAGLAISLSDPGGPLELVKETAATLRVVTQPGERGALVGAVATEAAADARARKSPFGDFKPKGAQAGQEIIDEIAAVNAIVTAKADPDEAEAYAPGSGTPRARRRTRPRKAASSASTPSA